jgi:CubicO group peptidase (beta-lactamase class C family)
MRCFNYYSQRRALVIALCIVQAVAAEAVAQQENPARPLPTIDEGRRLVGEFMESQHVPGLSVAVWKDGRFVWSEGFGLADLETRVAVWPHTRFRIGSISKPLTAAALAKLYEQERIKLDDPVWHYVPSFPEKQHPVTVRQVAGHLSGIRHYRGSEFLIRRQYDSVLDSLTIFQHDPLLHTPGEKFTYSSYGYNLLSAVVEQAGDQPFLEYMDSTVFQPLGMRHTVADQPAQIIDNRTRFYARNEEGQWVNAPYVNNSYKWAGGGFLSTPEDICRFAAAHLKRRFLKKKTVRLLWTSQQTLDGKETGYGIGWQVSKDDAGRKRVGHGGGSVGGSSRLVMYPKQKLILAVTTNMTQVRFEDIHYQIAELFLPRPVE